MARSKNTSPRAAPDSSSAATPAPVARGTQETRMPPAPKRRHCRSLLHPAVLTKVLVAALLAYLAFYTVNDVLCAPSRGKCPASYVRLRTQVLPRYTPAINAARTRVTDLYTAYVQPPAHKLCVGASTAAKPLLDSASLYLNTHVFNTDAYKTVSTRAVAVFALARRFFWSEFHKLAVFIADEVIPFILNTVLVRLAHATGAAAIHIDRAATHVTTAIRTSTLYKTHLAGHVAVLTANPYYRTVANHLHANWQVVKSLAL